MRLSCGNVDSGLYNYGDIVNNVVHYGVVLRSHMPYEHKVVLLDRVMGMIDAIIVKKTQASRITHGMLISYSVVTRNERYQINDIVVLAGPAQWVKDDIVFFHHALELAHAFLSYHQTSLDVFELFVRLYKPLVYEDSKYFKRCFLCKFFMLVGICPDDESSFCPQFFNLISRPIDIMVKRQSAFSDTSQILRWLQGCIAVHPDAHSLKTIFFLTQMGDHEAQV
jgi:hypothetical protein